MQTRNVFYENVLGKVDTVHLLAELQVHADCPVNLSIDMSTRDNQPHLQILIAFYHNNLGPQFRLAYSGAIQGKAGFIQAAQIHQTCEALSLKVSSCEY